MKSRRYATRRLMRRLEKLKAYFLSRYSEARARADGLGDPAQLTAATWEASTWDEAIGFLSEIVDGKQTSISARGIGASHVSENGLHRLPSHLMAHLGIPHGGGVYLTAEISPGVVTIESEDCWNKRSGFPVESMPEDYAHGFKTDDVVIWTVDRTSRGCDLVVRRAYATSVVVQKAGKGEGDEWRAFHVKPEELQRAPVNNGYWVRNLRQPREASVRFTEKLKAERADYVQVAPPKQEAASADFEPGDIVTTLELDGVARYVVKSVSLAGSSVDIITNQDGLTKTIEPKFLRRPDVREGDWVRCPERPQDGFFVMPASDMARVSKFVPVVTRFPSAPAPAPPPEIKLGDTVERAGNSGVVTGVRWDHLTVETDRGTRYWRHDEVTLQAPPAPPLACDFEAGDLALCTMENGTISRCIVRLAATPAQPLVTVEFTGNIALSVSREDLRHLPIKENEEFWVRCTEHPGKTFHMSSEEFEAHEDHFAKLVPVDGPEEEAPRQAPAAGFRYTRDNVNFERGDTLWCGAFPAGHTSKVIDVSPEAATMWERLFGTKLSRDGFIRESVWPDRREFFFELLNQGLVMLVVSSNKIEIATARIANAVPPQKQALDRLVGKERGPVFFLWKEMAMEHGHFYCVHSGERPGQTVVFHSPSTDTWGASFKTRNKYGPRLTCITVTGYASPQDAANALVNELRVTRSELTTMLAAHSKETQVPITPAPETAVQNPPMKLLRVGFFRDKKLIKQKEYFPTDQGVQLVTVGTDPCADFHSDSFEYSFVLIRLSSTGHTLNFTESMSGHTGVRLITRDLEGLRNDDVAKKSENHWELDLTEDMHGQLNLDDHTIMAFKFVDVVLLDQPGSTAATEEPPAPLSAPSATSPSPKLLRVGMLNDSVGLVKEHISFQPEKSVTIGTHKDNDFVTTDFFHAAEKFDLFQTLEGQHVLNFTNSMRGHVKHDGVLKKLYDLRASGIAKLVEGTEIWRLRLDDDSRGRITTGNESFLFQFVSAPTTDVPPEPSPEPPTEPSGPQGDEEVSVDHALFNAFATIASSLEPESQASDPSDVYDQLVSSDYCNKFVKGSSLKKPARVGDLFVSDGKAFMVRLQENYKKPSTPTVERVTLHMGYHLSHGLNDIRQGDAIAAKINRALVPAILMPETMDGKFPKVERHDSVLSVGTLVKMPGGTRGVVMGYHDGAYMVQRELFRCGHELLRLGLDATEVPAPKSEPKNTASPERRVRPRKPGPNQVIELHQSAYLPDSVSQDEELVLRELDTNSNAGWWTAWWPRKAAIVRIRLSDWEPVTGTASAPPSPSLVLAVNLGRYRLSPVGKHALVGAGPRTLHSTIDSAQQQVAQHRVLSPRWTQETPRLWISERGADDTVLRIEITEEKVW